jgi:hypothetical protein
LLIVPSICASSVPSYCRECHQYAAAPAATSTATPMKISRRLEWG